MGLENAGGLQPRNTKIFIAVISAQIFFWTLIPTLLRPNLPFDVIEGLAWGKEWQLGYPKHPPLAFWLLEISYRVFRQHTLAPYLLSQLSVAAAFYFTYKLALEIVRRPANAVVAALLQQTIFYYTYTSLEFNPNVLQLPLWAIFSYFLYRTCKVQKYRDAALVGVTAGLLLLTKYFSLFLIVPGLCFVFAVGVPKRKIVRLMTIAFIFFVLISLPHLLWIVQNEMKPITYAFGRGTYASGDHHFDGVRSAIHFINSQIPALLPSVLFLTMSWKLRRVRLETDQFNFLFLIVMGLGPAVFCLFFFAFSGLKFISMWGAPLWFLWGILVVYFFLGNGQAVPAIRWSILCNAVALIAVAVVVSFGPRITGRGTKAHFPGRQLVKQSQSIWGKRFGSPLTYVVGATELAGSFAAYGSRREKLLLHGDFEACPWIDKNEFYRHGALILWHRSRHQNSPFRFPERCFESPSDVLVLPWLTSAKIAPVEIGYAFVLPGVCRSASD